MGITYNDSDIINIKDTETGLKMLDKLSRIKDGRRIEPLDALDNVFYQHRYLYDEYNLQIGDTYFMIPPEFILINSESTSQSIVTLRQENTQKMKAGHHKRTILIDLVFNGPEQLNGYPVDGPEGTYYVDGLRQLLAQFKCTPFLPISNELINGMYGIFTVALQSITMSTLQGFPNVMTAQITLQEVNMFPYIEMPDVCFKYMIDWDLFRFYYQRLLTESYEYKKLQSLPANKDHSKFKISILDESVFNSKDATKSNMLDIICDKTIIKTDEDGRLAETNYTTWLDSSDSNVVISSFQCGYSNILTNIQLSDVSSPTLQFIGGMDTIYNIVFETTDYTVVQALEQCQMSNDLLVRNNAKLCSLGFVRLESELVAFTGSLFVVIDSVTTNTVPGFPGLYNIQMNCISYDISQSDRENLHGFKPFDCNKGGRCGEYDTNTSEFVSDHNHEEEAIEQSMMGLYIKAKQDNYAEWKIRTSMEVYPDLRLPTYAEVNEFINKCITFRNKNDLSKLPYTEYPTNPVCMLHGNNPDNRIEIETEDGIGYMKNISRESLEYNIFVDPDFYVFYPCSYLSFHNQQEADESPYYEYQPKQRSSFTKTKVVRKTPNYGEGSINSDIVEQFIAEAKRHIGCTYVWGAEGEQSDSKGKCFDCSGFVTYCLKRIGVMPNSKSRFTVSTMPGDDLFTEVSWSEMRRGDILCNASLKHVVIYEGDNQIIHAANSSPYPKGGVKESDLYFTGGRCLRPKAFIGSQGEGVSNNTSGFYVTDEFLKMVESWEGFLGKAEARDGGIDIGYGFHNTYFNGTDTVTIKYGMTMTKEEAENYLKLELESLIPRTLSKLSENGWDSSQFTNNQILALTSYYYNRGYYNDSADQILNKNNSPNITAIGNNLPKYWGKASYAKQGLINRRNKEKTLFFSTSKGAAASSTSFQYPLTTAELESICRVVMAETQGETVDAERAVAQVIYDRLTHPDKIFGGLSNILNSTDQFKAPYQGELNSTVENNVMEVFCNNDKYWPDWKAWYFLTPEDTNATFQDRDANYDRLGEVGKHVFWGEESPGSEIKYEIVDSNNTGAASSNTDEQEYDVTHEARTADDIDRFAEPVLVKTDAMIYDDSWSFWKNDANKEHAKKYLNDGLNIFYTSFCDEYQYSARGRLVRAFPTYLFCILDDNAQWFDGRKLWTNYYVTRSVVDIAVHGTNDMPTETATITITNSYHNLDRTQGGLNNYSIAEDDGYNGFTRWVYSWSGMLMGNGPKLTDKLIKLQQVIYDHAKLREGARIHLRIGYGSDPLSLAPMINGHISDVALGDQISMVVTSDGHELIQHVTSSNKKDSNQGFLGLFGLGTDQESSNIIANVMCKRQSWFHYLNNKTFEGSAYGIEHFGLYFNQQAMAFTSATLTGAVVGGVAAGMSGGGTVGAAVGSVVPVAGTAVGAVVGTVAGALVGASVGALVGLFQSSTINIADLWNGVQEQYDILKNIYKGDYTREHYIYSDFIADGEKNFVFNKYNMTPWDVCQISTQQVPEYILKPSYHQFDSRLYFGLPFWMEKFRYDYLNGILYEECKASTQIHVLDSINNIVDNQVKVTSKFSNTNVKVMYTRGSSGISTKTIHSDTTIDFAYQKTTILDTPITQDALGPDMIYEFLGYDIGEESARRVGISNLLYGWQQQYQGQIILLGSPGIKPHDYVMIYDSFAEMYGVALVREVVHNFNINTGFTTSVTLGMIGFSTDETSGMIQTCQNLLSVLNCFSSYIETRRQLRNNYEQHINIFSNFEILRNKFTTSVTRHTITKSAHFWKDAILLIPEAIQGYKCVKAAYQIAKNIKNLAKAGKLIKNFTRAYKLAKHGATGIKATLHAIKIGGAVVAGAPTGGVGSLIWLAVWLAIDILLDEVFEWLENRNVCVLLPLWWNGYPFVSGTKGGENILLIKANAPTEENTGGSVAEETKNNSDAAESDSLD